MDEAPLQGMGKFDVRLGSQKLSAAGMILEGFSEAEDTGLIDTNPVDGSAVVIFQGHARAHAYLCMTAITRSQPIFSSHAS